jgi:hypothetical protein
MTARLSVTLAIAFVSLMPFRLDAQENKYDIKSGIITYETLTVEGRVQIAGRIVVSFDQYGRLECKDTYVGGMLKESVLCDGRTVYTVLHDQRIVFRRGPATRGTEVRFDWEAMPVSEKSQGHAKKISSMNVAGKICEAFERTVPQGKVTYAGVDHILLYCERNLQGENWVMKAVSVEEPKTIPAWKFVPPPGYTEREAHF